MTREQKLAHHLGMVIWEGLPKDEMLDDAEAERRIARATPSQKQRAYTRALSRSPMLLDDER
jgi:hypothetical protein